MVTQSLIKENDFFKPSTPYAVSRSAQDLNLKAYLHTLSSLLFSQERQMYTDPINNYIELPKTIIKSQKKKH